MQNSSTATAAGATPHRPRFRRYSTRAWLKGQENPAGDRRLPDSRRNSHVVAMFAGLEERPGRPVDPLLARAIYDEVEFVTRTDGLIFMTFARVAERVNISRSRLPRAITEPMPQATQAKVSAVVRCMVRAGWLSEVRKTCRQVVFAVDRPPAASRRAGASAGAKARLLNYSPSPIGEDPVFDHENATDLSSRPGCVPEADELLRRARDLASRLVNHHKANLRCRGTKNATGAWWRALVNRLRWYAPDQQMKLARAYHERLAYLGAKARGVWLSDRALNLRSGC